MLKVGLIGCGGISGAHVPAWQAMDDVELIALCDIRPEKMQRYAVRKQYTDFDAMLAEKQLDIIDVCLPTYLHCEYALRSMEKGINVITEKPIALREEDVHTLYAAAKKHNVKYMVAQCLRFWDDYDLIKQIYDSGRYGRLLSAHMWRLGSYPGGGWNQWYYKEELSGLIPFDLHIHDLDFLVYAFGLPKDYRFKRQKLPEQDYLSVEYDYGDFFITTEASWYQAKYPFTMGFRFQFEEAVVALENKELTIYDSHGNRIKPYSDDVTENQSDFELPSGDAYANELRYFADCVKNDRPVEKVDKDSLLAVLKILNEMK